MVSASLWLSVLCVVGRPQGEALLPTASTSHLPPLQFLPLGFKLLCNPSLPFPFPLRSIIFTVKMNFLTFHALTKISLISFLTFDQFLPQSLNQLLLGPRLQGRPQVMTHYVRKHLLLLISGPFRHCRNHKTLCHPLLSFNYFLIQRRVLKQLICYSKNQV